MTIGERIKIRRKEIKLSVDELASRLGKDRSTVYRYENGEIEKLPIDMLTPIADALETTPEYLMGWEGAEPEEIGAFAAEVLLDADLVQLIKNYRAMSEADQYALRLMAESLAAKTKKD